ncbi:MAG: hypothetical protein ACREYF_18595 [Gammaproteobacteria bacterium]
MRVAVVSTVFFVGCGGAKIQNRLNQEHARSGLVKIRNAQKIFKASSQSGKYGTLEELAKAKLIDSSLSAGKYKGYLFKVRGDGASYEAVAVPEKYGYTGFWSFYVNEEGTIRGEVKSGQEATVNDPPIKTE